MAYGLQIFDGSGDLRLDTDDRLMKYISSSVYTMSQYQPQIPNSQGQLPTEVIYYENGVYGEFRVCPVHYTGLTYSQDTQYDLPGFFYAPRYILNTSNITVTPGNSLVGIISECTYTSVFIDDIWADYLMTIIGRKPFCVTAADNSYISIYLGTVLTYDAYTSTVDLIYMDSTWTSRCSNFKFKVTIYER